MSQLKRNRKIQRQILKISAKILERAITELTRKGPNVQSKGVHNARKQLKRLRGIFRMVRPGISDKNFRRANKVFRDAGRPLSEARDADVMIETLDLLVKHYRQQVKAAAFHDLRRALLKRRREIRRGLKGRAGVRRSVTVSLKKASTRLEKWTSIGNDYKVLLRGVKETHSAGKKEMELAQDKPSVENLHQWRKSVKYLRYQLDVLAPLWPAVLEPTVAELHHLADVLGFDHDLAVLEGLIGNECKDCCQPEDRELLHALINQRRQELQAEAFAIGPKLYAESPKQFAGRLQDYWRSFLKEPAPVVAA